MGSYISVLCMDFNKHIYNENHYALRAKFIATSLLVAQCSKVISLHGPRVHQTPLGFFSSFLCFFFQLYAFSSLVFTKHLYAFYAFFPALCFLCFFFQARVHQTPLCFFSSFMLFPVFFPASCSPNTFMLFILFFQLYAFYVFFPTFFSSLVFTKHLYAFFSSFMLFFFLQFFFQPPVHQTSLCFFFQLYAFFPAFFFQPRVHQTPLCFFSSFMLFMLFFQFFFSASCSPNTFMLFFPALCFLCFFSSFFFQPRVHQTPLCLLCFFSSFMLFMLFSSFFSSLVFTKHLYAFYAFFPAIGLDEGRCVLLAERARASGVLTQLPQPGNWREGTHQPVWGGPRKQTGSGWVSLELKIHY